MTCIVGITDGTTVTMGADSAGSSGNYTLQRKDPKVFIKGQYLIGFTSSFRMGQLLMYKFKPALLPLYCDGDELHAHMCTTFVDEIRKLFKDNGFTTIKDSVETGGCFLVGVNGRLFEIDDDFQVGESIRNYSAVGSGTFYALGALFASNRRDIEPEQRVIQALAAAEAFSPTVSGPFKVLTLKPGGMS
jgi:ATP-dependent protease HslVU (ClpYQ) peptidase subunit